jgi:cation diffusion facilitator CzcD-associated flavoprotein CzcO
MDSMMDTVMKTGPALRADPQVETADVLIAGTGFAGLCAAIKLQQSGNRSFLLLEKAQDYGGTWRDNIYPGCACDIPSHLYSFSFEPNANWSRMFPTQPEILAYLRGVAQKHDLPGRTRFGAAIREAAWDEAAQKWCVYTADGRRFFGRVLLSAMGPLHIPSYPKLTGLGTFAGPAFHSARWDDSVDLAGKRVAVIGTGASAIQFIPRIAEQAAHLTVFQRSPAWIMPKMDYAFSEDQKRDFRQPLRRRLFRTKLFWIHDIRALGFLGNRKVTETAEAIARAHLKRKIADPALREKLTPAYRLGCKRVLISNDFYQAIARETTDLVTTPIASIEPDRVITADGAAYQADVLIFGTGFHTTDSFSAVRIVGRNGLTLQQAFAGGLHAYRGMAVPGFPNFFFLLGPNTGLGHNSVVLMIEAQMHYLLSLFAKMARRGWRVAEVRPEIEEDWNRRMHARLAKTVWMTGGCNSWYLDDNGRNTTIWPGLVAEYQLKMRSARLGDYHSP